MTHSLYREHHLLHFRSERKLPEFSQLSVFNHSRTSRLWPQKHRGITTSSPLFHAVTCLDSSENWKSHIFALNLYITSSPLWCMPVTSGVQASLKDLLKQLIYSVILPHFYVAKISILFQMIWEINLTNQNDLCLTSSSCVHYLFWTLIICNWSNILPRHVVQFLFPD